MRIIAVDNFARETVADRLVAEVAAKGEAAAMLEGLLATCAPDGAWWYKIVDDDYVLSRGMADLA